MAFTAVGVIDERVVKFCGFPGEGCVADAAFPRIVIDGDLKLVAFTAAASYSTELPILMA